MTDMDREFMADLLATFRAEADEHQRAITSGLMEMEKAETPERRMEIAEKVFREMHSLKGAARSVRRVHIETFCQAMEDLLATLKRGEIVFSPGLFDLLHHATDFLCPLLSRDDNALTSDEELKRRDFMEQLENGARGEVEPAPSAPVQAAPEREAAPPEYPIGPPSYEALTGAAETVRVSNARLSAVLLKSEEMLTVKHTAIQRVRQSREMRRAFPAWKKEWARILPETRKLKLHAARIAGREADDAARSANRALLKVLDFLDWNRDYLSALERSHAEGAKMARLDSLSLSGMVSDLLEDTKNLMLFPFSSLLESFPKLVRDLSRDSGKLAELAVRGGEMEIDRRILDEMRAPFVHMIRNCIDHGIETPSERRRKRKPEKGTVTITVSPVDDKVEVIVADDGSGIAVEKVRSAVIRLGIIPRDKADGYADLELLPYVFQSGVSTSPIITDLSGRGLGLAIVREKVEKLGGAVSLETLPDAGTSIRMVIPVTVATFSGIPVRVGESVFVIPTAHAERVMRLKREEIATVESRETIRVDEQTVSLARLADVLELPIVKSRPDPADFLPAIILSCGGEKIAFLVDEVLGEQEVLFKHLGRQLSRVRNVAGATLVGSGRLAPVLNVSDLIKSAVRSPVAQKTAPAAVSEGLAGKRSILVVEDSLTTRTLLRNILQSVGYEVVTAVDGLDALVRLKSDEFDIVVSDVDMPRMNGFDLTAGIRADKRLAGLPVVLVTALESREDRERGIVVGANAYLVKSSFDQSNLLEVIKRLV